MPYCAAYSEPSPRVAALNHSKYVPYLTSMLHGTPLACSHPHSHIKYTSFTELFTWRPNLVPPQTLGENHNPPQSPVFLYLLERRFGKRTGQGSSLIPQWIVCVEQAANDFKMVGYRLQGRRRKPRVVTSASKSASVIQWKNGHCMCDPEPPPRELYGYSLPKATSPNLSR